MTDFENIFLQYFQSNICPFCNHIDSNYLSPHCLQINVWLCSAISTERFVQCSPFITHMTTDSRKRQLAFTEIANWNCPTKLYFLIISIIKMHTSRKIVKNLLHSSILTFHDFLSNLKLLWVNWTKTRMKLTLLPKIILRHI